MLTKQIALLRIVARTVAPAVAGLFLLTLVSPGGAQEARNPAAGTTMIAGRVLDTVSGLPISGAIVTLFRSGASVATATTDAGGNYHFASQRAAIYSIGVQRRGYVGGRSEDVAVVQGETGVDINVALTPGQGGSQQSGLRQIGAVSASASLGGALQTTSTISRGVNSTLLSKENVVSVGEGLSRLSGVNVAGTHSSAVGDELSISLRGFDPTESQALLDGHPIGPIGVQGGGFNFQDGPLYVLKSTNVVFGAGALGLYGTDATGGAIDMQTLDPTQRPSLDLTQGIGTLGRSFTSLQATGSYGRLGYVVAGGTSGAYGNYSPQNITQTGLLGGNFSAANYAANTYSVSGNFNSKDGLLKLQYTLAPGTIATISAYSAQLYQDKTGIGDNDYTPYSLALQDAQAAAQAAASAATPSSPNPCPGGVQGIVTNAGGSACFTPAKFAALSYGPAGGGPSRWEFFNSQDYHGRLVTNYLGQTIAIDGFVDYYARGKNSSLTGAPCNDVPSCQSLFPGATFFTGDFFDQEYKTTGFLVSDDIARGINDFGFGYYTQHQKFTDTVFGSPNYTLIPGEPLFLGTDNIFMRDVFSPTKNIQLFTNVWYKLLSTTGQDTLDPRATLVLRPSPHDVIRVIAGKTDGEPAAELASQIITKDFNTLNPDCGTLAARNGGTNSDPLSIGQFAGNNLTQESATDYEVAVGHAFNNGSSIQAAAYDQHEKDIVNLVNVPLLPGQLPGPLLQGFYGRIRQLCGTYAGNLADLVGSQAVNTGQSGLFRGIELSGRVYATRDLYFDLSYDIQHAQLFGYSDSVLQSNPTLVNGGQEINIPLNKGSISADYTNRHGFEAHVDAYILGVNNDLNRGAYGYADGFLSYEAARSHTSLTFGISNIFNNSTDNYGRLGLGLQPALNSFANLYATTPPERFGLQTRSYLFTLTQHV